MVEGPRSLDAVGEAVGDHGILPVDEGREAIVLPDEHPLVSFGRVLQVKTQAGIVALVLDAGKPTAPTAEAHPPGLTCIHAAVAVRAERSACVFSSSSRGLWSLAVCCA